MSVYERRSKTDMDTRRTISSILMRRLSKAHQGCFEMIEQAGLRGTGSELRFEPVSIIKEHKGREASVALIRHESLGNPFLSSKIRTAIANTNLFHK